MNSKGMRIVVFCLFYSTDIDQTCADFIYSVGELSLKTLNVYIILISWLEKWCISRNKSYSIYLYE